MGYYGSMVILIPAILLSMYASMKVKSTFEKYSKVMSSSGYTGADIARRILSEQGINNVNVEHIRGNLTDHYDPRSKTVRLSENVYSAKSIAAISVAAHECGHAIQHNVGYVPLNIRSAIVPAAQIGSKMSMPLVILGMFMSSPTFIYIGVVVFSAAVIFQFVTLPVEFNASSRAIKVMLSSGIIDEREEAGARKVLSAAALTYVAAAISSLLTLIRLLIIARNER
ncbi:MAG: zinc metallopeptidase [Coprobacillaceae bacterium]